MVAPDQTRRTLCLGLTGLAGLTATGLRAEEIVDLSWRDLVPDGQAVIPPALLNPGAHDESAMASAQPPSTGVRPEWNGRIVRLSGFIIPIDYAGTRITAFMLVPYVGACIHVPPPPANQLVLVSTERPYDSDGLFESVTVTGKIGIASITTELAQVGYTMAATKVVRFRG